MLENKPLNYSENMLDGSAWPRISVVTPNYNYSDYIGDTIHSVVAQGYPNLEYIVIDDGSTDDSYKVISNYKPYLAHCEQQVNMGQARTINKGFGMSSGEIMAWLNSDDKYMPWTFAVVAEIFRAFPDVEWITGMPTIWDSQGRNVKAERGVYINKYDYCLGRYTWIQQESVFWRRSLWDRAGGYIDESYKLQIDCELWTRFFKLADLWHVDSCIGGYRYHSATRSSNNMDETHREARRAITDFIGSCDTKIIQDVRLLRELSKLKFLDGMLDMSSVIERVFPKLWSRIAYNEISWAGECGKWYPKKIPFRLFRKP